MNIQEKLFSMNDLNYRNFCAKLMPTVDKETIIGIKTPELKKLAKKIEKSGYADAFMKDLPHKYFEENQLHAFIISNIKDTDSAVCELENFLPYVNNWATCDQLILKAFAKNPDIAKKKADKWIKSNHTYTVRFAIGIYMRYFLDDKFKSEYLSLIASIKSDDYYVNMMSAWYFATALAKQYDAALPVFKTNKLSIWVHNKAIQKARESFRVTSEHKEELNKLKRK